MDLKYIWVNNYRILKNIGFNFNHGGEHQFNYENEKLQLLPNIKPDLDFGPNINGLTVIAGQNGSGKSSLCEVILLTTATLTNGLFGYDIEFGGIVCYGNHIFYHKDLQIQNLEELEGSGYILKLFDKSPFEEMEWEWKNQFIKGGFIYYSNMLDLRSDFEAVNLANISSQTFIRQDYKYSTNYTSDNIYGINEPAHFRGKDRHSPTTIYYRGEGYRATKFYVNHPHLIPFAAPKKLKIKSAYSGDNRWLSLHTIEDFDERNAYKNLEDQILSNVSPDFVDEDDNERRKANNEDFKKAIHLLYRLNVIICIGIARRALPAANLVEDFVFNDASAQRLYDDFEIIDALVSLHRRIVNNAEIIDFEYKPYSVKSYYNEKVNDWRFYLIESLMLPNTQPNLELLRDFISQEETTLKEDHGPFRRISNYSLFPQLSAGENSFFTFFSRLYDVIERYRASIDNRNTLILFIDEGEIGFHPAWKKKYLKWLLDFINNHIENFRFQLILTTHSPYLLSDIVSSNIILLKKVKYEIENGYEEERTEIVSSRFFSTFGANIHELLANSFFLNDGTIGEFAKEKIQWVIDKLNEWREIKRRDHKQFSGILDELEVTKQQVFTIINQIGDMIVRNKLFEMYLEIFEDASAIENEISQLQMRINLLKGRQ